MAAVSLACCMEKEDPKNHIVECITCQIRAHQGCAGGPWRDLKTWICRCCRYHLSQHEGKVSVKFLEARETQKCYLCNTSTIALMAKGWKQEEVVKQVTNHNNSSAESKTEITGVQTSTPIRWVHYVCGEYLPGPQLRLPLFSPQRDINWDMMQWIPQHVDFNGGFEYCDNVPAINKRITCEYCPHAGGSGLRCCAPGCKRAFHPVCRLKANLPLYAHVDPATNQIAVAMHHKTLNQQVLIFCSIHLTSKIEDIKTTASTKVQNNDKEDEDDDEGDSSGSSSDSSSDDDDSSSCTEETKVAVVVPRKSTIIARNKADKADSRKTKNVSFLADRKRKNSAIKKQPQRSCKKARS